MTHPFDPFTDNERATRHALEVYGDLYARPEDVVLKHPIPMELLKTMKTHDDFFGPVALVMASAVPNATVQNYIYGEVTAVGGDHFVVETHVGRGTFSRTTGRCLESQWRNLQSYVIAADEMDRFAAITARARAQPRDGGVSPHPAA